MNIALISSNLQAFLDMIAVSEGTKNLGDDGYNVLVGGTLFDGYADHPRKVVVLNKMLRSTAAGRYQILSRYFDVYRRRMKLADFSPTSQDRIAICMIREQDALDDIENGRFGVAVEKCSNIWASLPGAGYKQRQNTLAYLQDVYTKQGGMLA
jgi:muramidase (phage lysozyme)